MSLYGKVRQKCFIDSHQFSNTFLTSANATNQTIFEDYTCNHNKTLLLLSSVDPEQSASDTAQSLSITIRTRDCQRTITAVIPPFGVRIFQVEDFESLTVSNLSNAIGALLVSVQKTFCICCENTQKNDCCDKKPCSCSHCFNRSTSLLD